MSYENLLRRAVDDVAEARRRVHITKSIQNRKIVAVQVKWLGPENNEAEQELAWKEYKEAEGAHLATQRAIVAAERRLAEVQSWGGGSCT
jgi:hypothetical protein